MWCGSCGSKRAEGGGREGGRGRIFVCRGLLYAGLSLKLAEGILFSCVGLEGICYGEETGVEKCNY